MRYLGLVFLVMVLLAGQAAADDHVRKVEGPRAATVLVFGEVVASTWDTTTFTRHTRVIYKERYWLCKDSQLLGKTIFVTCLTYKDK